MAFINSSIAETPILYRFNNGFFFFFFWKTGSDSWK
jgi:hypothetical protein